MSRRSTTSKFTGLSNAIQKLNTFHRETPQVVQEELRTLGFRIQTHARNLAPMQTGRLRKGIQTRILRNTLYVYTHAYNPRTGYDYAYIQHNNPDYKHSIGEYRFLTKAVNMERNNYIHRVQRRLNKFG